jgi:hypothetical protein
MRNVFPPRIRVKKPARSFLTGHYALVFGVRNEKNALILISVKYALTVIMFTTPHKNRGITNLTSCGG